MATGVVKAKGKRGTGIRIKNPLSLSVLVLIKDGQHPVGFDITRSLKPGQEIYLSLPHGDYDIETKIVRYDPTGQSRVMGNGGWKSTFSSSTVKPNMPLKPGPVLQSGQKKVKSREIPLRSLGDQIEEMKKREEVAV